MRAGVALSLTTTGADGRFYGTQSLALLCRDAPRRDWTLTALVVCTLPTDHLIKLVA
jgi:hypothetical protein